MMKSIIRDDYKGYLLGLLKHLVSICEQQGILYYLDGGTCLGAIRHNGFIPWDDDIDVALPRDEYDRLIAFLLQSQSKNDRFKILTFRTEPTYYYPYAKLIDTSTVMVEAGCKSINGYGIHIDIFPIDGIPNDCKERQRFLKKRLRIKRWIGLKAAKISSFHQFLYFLFRYPIKFVLPSAQMLCQIMERSCRQYKCEESEYVMDSTWTQKNSQYYPRYCIQSLERHVFEDAQYSIPSHHDVFLSALYGEYMKMPPQNERKIHPNTAYMRD